MNRRQALSITAAMLLAVPAAPFVLAQQTEAPAAPPHSQPSVDDHLHMLAQKLDLTAEQQGKARPILADMQAEMQKIVDDKSLPPDEAMSKRHAVFMKADKQVREFLTDDQKTKLDELEQQMHSGSHGDSPSRHD